MHVRLQTKEDAVNFAAIQRAQATLFRSQYKIGPKCPYGLRDEDIATAFHVSSPSKGGTIVLDKQGGGTEKLKAALPADLHTHYDKLQIDPRFDRFLLLSKGQGVDLALDGMVVGFANDDFYYIVAVWDINGHDIWEPNPGDVRTPLVVWD